MQDNIILLAEVLSEQIDDIVFVSCKNNIINLQEFPNCNLSYIGPAKVLFKTNTYAILELKISCFPELKLDFFKKEYNYYVNNLKKTSFIISVPRKLFKTFGIGENENKI